MSLDKKCKCVNFYGIGKRLTHLNKSDAQESLLLDLFDAGYKNAYVSVIDFSSNQNNDYCRVEIFLPNVGRLCLYQTFVDVLDVQIPHIDIFYFTIANPNQRTKIINQDLLKRAAGIIYKTKRYFENHNECELSDNEVIKRSFVNQKLVRKQNERYAKRRLGILRTFLIKEK